jgi:tRNA-splicing ligase RtcB
MIKVISSERIPIKLWLDSIEEGALQQAKNLANLPFAFKHISIMPDSHQGYGMPIGGVLATDKVIIPNAVGVDIGCGMCAVLVNLINMKKINLEKIVDLIKETVPVGKNWHEKKQSNILMPKRQSKEYMPIVWQQYEKALYQLGTLGGGNHFIEIQHGSDNQIWIMVHSGSRNIGKQVADHYNKLATYLNERWHTQVPKEHQLAFLPIDSIEGKQYRNEMEYCVDFALANRSLIMERIQNIFVSVYSDINISFAPMINIAHNYAAMENHFGRNVMVHRKGATQAREGQLGIIPGSQGSKSYIVKGKGNMESFQSCSHGAGRRLGRKQAKRELNLEEQKRIMDDQGIIHSIKSIKNLDEAPGAYKDIDVVMKNQSDLVDIVVELSPLAVIKEEEE